MKTGINFAPLYDKVVVQPEEKEKVSAGGIYLTPGSANETFETGTVAGVGDWRFLDNGTKKETSLSLGDRVCYSSNCAKVEIKVDGIKYVVVNEMDILGVFKPQN